MEIIYNLMENQDGHDHIPKNLEMYNHPEEHNKKT